MDGPVLIGDTVRLVPLDQRDADAWLAGAAPAAPPDAVASQIGRWQASWRTLGALRHWGIWTLASDALLGGVAVEDAGDGQRVVDLQLLIFAPYRRRGFGAEATRLALDYAVREMGATHATMHLGDGRDGAVAMARRLGATAVHAEPAHPERAFLVTRLDLGATG